MGQSLMKFAPGSDENKAKEIGPIIESCYDTYLSGTDKKHHQGKGKTLTKEEFQKILQDVVMEAGVSGVGAKDLILYIFGVPVTALFIKQRIIPGALPNEIFIPVITSATVFVLAKLNKI
ncbi:hypothetical protein RHMOL_Rhmol03G0040400 [Rhododendron molle]|uniref:Uncharacterized protein n=1 Tax=Rhododendron molle TaxID=49168 RepID=A0ACC0PA36_RHOML|nr:hypothetical protein RHMOL_Rhmol03G0040400 [Rhododendron molle]